jgi:hypothetical protein
MMVCAAGCFRPAPAIEHVDLSAARLAYPDLCLPADAVDICAFEEVGGLQSLQRLYRCALPRERLSSAADEMAKQSEAKLKREYAYETQPLSPAVNTWPRWAKEKLAWWTPDLITDGYYQGAEEAYGLRMWVDRGRGIIFVYQSD